MRAHEERVVDELQQLTGRREKLAEFLVTNFCTTLPDEEQRRLRRQYDIMVQYEGVLSERIAAFPPAASAVGVKK